MSRENLASDSSRMCGGAKLIKASRAAVRAEWICSSNSFAGHSLEFVQFILDFVTRINVSSIEMTLV